MLKLPSYQQLSKEQDTIYNLPLAGSHLVMGPPGTGKTVMAIYRSSMFKKRKKRSNFIVYNRPLRQYLEQATTEVDIDGVTKTFHKWFFSWYRETFHREVPMLAPFIFDWDKIHASLTELVDRYDHLIIDEGQDFPKDFYIVMQLLSTDITVFADENQRITDQNSIIEDIRLYLSTEKPHKLTKNYRNTRPIAAFAQSFYAGLQSGWPDLPERDGPKPRAISTPDLNTQVEFIARYEQNNADRDIGVFVATNQQQYAIYRLLQRHQLQNPVQMYISNDQDFKELSFHQRGIKILTYKSAKGLEFDAVFLPELEKRHSAPNSELEKMQFYVLTTRARENLFLLYSGDRLPPLFQLVSPDLFAVSEEKGNSLPFDVYEEEDSFPW